MQPLQVCTVSNRKLEDADENEQLGKAKLMQLMLDEQKQQKSYTFALLSTSDQKRSYIRTFEHF